MSAIPNRSILSSTYKGLKKKNQLTLNSLPIAFFACVLLVLIYGLVLLVCVGGVNEGLVIGVLCLNFFWFCIIYPQIRELSLRDSEIRALFFYFFFSSIITVASVVLFPSLAKTTMQEGRMQDQLALLVVGIEILSKQLMDYTSNFVNYMVEGSSTKSWMEYAKYQALWKLIQLVGSLVAVILLFAMVLPVSISQLDLSEWEKVIIYGIGFPFFRYLCGKALETAIHSMDELGHFPERDVKLKMFFIIKIGVTISFGATPLFSMLSSSPDILFFSLQYVPHAFISKLSWMKNIPFIHEKIKKMRTIMHRAFSCCREKLVVKPQGEKQVKRESNVSKAVKRATIDMIKRVTIDLILENNKFANQDGPSIINRNAGEKEEEEEDENKLEEIENGNYVMITEAVAVLADKIAIIAYAMALLNLLFFSTGSSGGVEFGILVQALACVFGVVFIFDQISAIWGFAMLEYHGIELDTDLGLAHNPLNPLKTFKNGNRWKAVGDLMFMSSACVSVFLAIAFAQTVKLF